MPDRRRPGDHAHPRPASSGARDRRRRRPHPLPESRANSSSLIRLAPFALVLGLLVAGCGGSSKSEPTAAEAKPFTDSFVHRLVEVGSWDAVEGDISPQLVPEVRSFQQQIKRDGVHRVAKKGVLHHDCPPAPAVGAGKDCYVYVLSGSQVIPIGGTQKLVAHLRVWPSYEGGSWQVINYDYAIVPPPA